MRGRVGDILQTRKEKKNPTIPTFTQVESTGKSWKEAFGVLPRPLSKPWEVWDRKVRILAVPVFRQAEDSSNKSQAGVNSLEKLTQPRWLAKKRFGDGKADEGLGGESGRKKGWASWGTEGKYLGEKGILGARKREVVYTGEVEWGWGMKFVEKFHYSFFPVIISEVLSVENRVNGPVTPKFTSFLFHFHCVTGQSMWRLLSSHFFRSLHKWLVQTCANSYFIYEPEFLPLYLFPTPMDSALCRVNQSSGCRLGFALLKKNWVLSNLNSFIMSPKKKNLLICQTQEENIGEMPDESKSAVAL